MTLARTKGLKPSAFKRADRKEASAIKKLRPKKCQACRQPFAPRSAWAKACSPTCAAIVAQQKREAEERKDIRVRKVAMKGLREWIADTQVAFNAFVRERDRLAGHSCISSGKPLDWSGNNVDAGHYRSRGSAPHLRFDERNCHAQSKQENRYASGNATDYRIGLIARIGLSAVEELEADNTARKYTIDELKAIKALYVAKLKELRK
jgi:hypothetical protein